MFFYFLLSLLSTFIVSGGSEDMFGINADTGQVFLEKSLDASLHRGYSLQIRAFDGGRPPLSSICTLHVNVVLADNAPPRLVTSPVTQPTSFSVYIKEIFLIVLNN